MGEKKKKRCLDDLTRELPPHWRGSFGEYLDMMKEDAPKHMRTARQYVYNAVIAFGVEEVVVEETGEELTRYSLFTTDLPHRKENPVHGMDRCLEMLIKHLESRSIRIHDLPRMIVLNGPPGSSKSSTVERLKVALEEYSLTDDGACFTSTIILPVEALVTEKSDIGFLEKAAKEAVDSYAYLGRDDIAAQITCPQHDSPLLWYPREMREELLAEMGVDSASDEVLYGELCPVCSQIYDHLMAEYDDDLDEVLKHVRVDRVRFRGDVAGVATVAPGASQNLTALSLAQDPNYQIFTNLFPGIKLVELDGAYLKANRGLIHLEDFVKATKGNVNFLLRAISNGQLTTKDLRTGKEITVTVDEIIVSTDNVEEIEAIRKQGSQGFDSRIFVIDWPYVLEPSAEALIYANDFADRGCRDGICYERGLHHLAPHIEELTALFAVMTRMDRPESEKYRELDDYSEQVEELIKSLTPLDKAHLYEGRIPERFTKDEVRLLTPSLWKAIRTEHPSEGLQGIGVRDMQEVVNLLSGDEECLCVKPTDLFDVVEEFIKTKSFHYLNRFSRYGFHDPEQCLKLVREEYNHILADEVKQAMSSVSPEKIYDWIAEYVGLVTDSYEPKFLEGGEKKNKVDVVKLEERLGEFEELLGLNYIHEKDEYRDHVRARVAKYTDQLDSWDGYGRVFPELYDVIEDDNFSPVREIVFDDDGVRMEFLEALAEFDPEAPSETPKPYQFHLIRMFSNMQELEYCTDCARHSLIYALDNELV